MFNFLETSSRVEETLMLLLATAAGFVPSVLLIAVVAVGREYDPKFGYLGSVQLVAMFASLIALGAAVAIVAAVVTRVAAGPLPHIVLGAFVALAAYGLFRFFANTSFLPSDFSILARVVSAQFVLASLVFVFELVVFRFRRRGHAARAAV